jgi:hypothetical protein
MKARPIYLVAEQSLKTAAGTGRAGDQTTRTAAE